MDEIDREWLTDMLEHARDAASFLGSRNATQLEEDRSTLYAVSYAVQIVGEAASRVSEQGRAAFPDVPWTKIIGMRHRLVHGYRTRSAGVLVSTVREHIPRLIAVLEAAKVEEDE